MSLDRVIVTQDAWFVCLAHALTTEKEEVMGLLLGDIEQRSGSNVAYVAAVAVLTRSDKRKDRVEISPEQLAGAAEEAERLSTLTERNIRVIGWYHSHPHITVNPSHVDVVTQWNYQMLDRGFIGLIFSCFNLDSADMTGRIQITAFQSREKQFNFNEIIDLNEDSPTSPLSSISYSEAEAIRKAEKASVEHATMHGGGYEESPVPMYIVAAPLNGPNNYEKVALLQEIMYLEEKQTYEDSLVDYTDARGNVNPLIAVHNNAVFQKALVRLLEVNVFPVLLLMQTIQKQNLLRIAELEKELQQLQQQQNKQIKQEPQQHQPQQIKQEKHQAAKKAKQR